MKYRIVGDSSTDLFTLNNGIEFVGAPLKILIDDKEYVDDGTINIEELVDHMERSEANSSSCPNVFDYKNSFEGADTIFVVTITSGLSGSYNAAYQASQEYMAEHPDVKIHVVDSLSAGSEPHLLVEKLEELMLKGLSFEEIRDAITKYQQHTHLIFALESLNNLAKNGRVNAHVAKIASLLGIRFIGIASEEGKLQQVHIARGEKKTLNLLVSEIISRGYGGGKIWIGNCLNVSAATKLKNMLLEKFPNGLIDIWPCSGLDSYYAERGGMMIGFEDKEVPQF